MASGIQHSELIANQVRREQAVLLSAVRQEQLDAEKAGYAAMLAQAAADAKSKVRRVVGYQLETEAPDRPATLDM
jgi:hypothetical protein